MKAESTNWLYVLEQELHPNSLCAHTENSGDFSNLIFRITHESTKFRPYFARQLGISRKQAITTILQLIFTSDTIYSYLVDTVSVRKGNPLSKQVKFIYRQTLNLLESHLDACGKFDNEIISSLPITAFSLSGTRMLLREQFNKLSTKIVASDINTELGELVLSGLQLLIRRKKITRSDIDYALAVMGELDKLESITTAAVESLLYQYDFNTPAFFNYWAKCCNRLMENTPSLHTQLEILIGLKDRMNGLPAKGVSKWMIEDQSIRDQLREFFKEKKRYIEQRIEIRRAEIQDGELSEEADRMQVNLPVAQLGLFIRMFMEKGLLPKKDVGKTFSYYARHFRTPKTPFISAESLQKKSTDVEFSTAKKTKGHLIGMINWLNENYNTTNHMDL